MLLLPYLPKEAHEFYIVPAPYGSFLSPFRGIYGIVLIELFGLDRMTVACGFSYFFQGLGTVSGPILGGLISDTRDSLALMFFIGGVVYIASSAFNFSAWLCHHRMKETPKNRSLYLQVTCCLILKINEIQFSTD